MQYEKRKATWCGKAAGRGSGTASELDGVGSQGVIRAG